MPNKHCSHGTCNSDERYALKDHMKDVLFFKFPDSEKQREEFERWVHACGRDGFTIKTAKSTPKNPKFVCSKHFVLGRPDAQNPVPFPAHYTPDQISKINQAAARRAKRTFSSIELEEPSTSSSTKQRKLSGLQSDFNSAVATDRNADVYSASSEQHHTEENHLAAQHAEQVSLFSTKQTQTDPDQEKLRLRTELCLLKNKVRLLQLKIDELNAVILQTSKQTALMGKADDVVNISNPKPSEEQPPAKLGSADRKLSRPNDCQSAAEAPNKISVLRSVLTDDSLLLNQPTPQPKKQSALKENQQETAYSKEQPKPRKEQPPTNQKSSERELSNPTSTNNCMYLFDNLSEDAQMFQYYTGMSLTSFSVLWHFVHEDGEKMQYVYTGKQRSKRIFSVKDELVLTLIRLRRGRCHQELAYETGTSESYVRHMFTTWIQLLYIKFDALRDVMFAPLSKVSQHTPPSMKGHNIRCIIDCTEFPCNQPKNFGKNGNRYSSYKGTTTFKVLIGIAPAGYVSYVSPCIEGSISDVALVRHECDFLDYIEKGDCVMADRGFMIGDVLAARGAKLMIPPFLKGRHRFTPQEEARTKFIAKNRIHVERAIEKIKKFKLLKARISSQFENLFSQCVFICACLVNFQHPLAL